MILWNALSKWITPKSVHVLQQCRSELFNNDHGEEYNTVVSPDVFQVQVVILAMVTIHHPYHHCTIQMI
jgi:hypothetical protein